MSKVEGTKIIKSNKWENCLILIPCARWAARRGGGAQPPAAAWHRHDAQDIAISRRGSHEMTGSTPVAVQINIYQISGVTIYRDTMVCSTVYLFYT